MCKNIDAFIGYYLSIFLEFLFLLRVNIFFNKINIFYFYLSEPVQPLIHTLIYTHSYLYYICHRISRYPLTNILVRDKVVNRI